MMIKCSVGGKNESIFQTVTIVPRLGYSSELLSEIIHDLELEREKLKTANKTMLDTSQDDKVLQNAIDRERTMVFSMETLTQIRQRIKAISEMSSIPKMLPPIIPAIRTISAQIHNTMPSCSQRLCELSVHLGSIVLDSAAISTAKFDFRQSNYESVMFLDEVKLMADSKISKQYRNLDSFKRQTA